MSGEQAPFMKKGSKVYPTPQPTDLLLHAEASMLGESEVDEIPLQHPFSTTATTTTTKQISPNSPELSTSQQPTQSQKQQQQQPQQQQQQQQQQKQPRASAATATTTNIPPSRPLTASKAWGDNGEQNPNNQFPAGKEEDQEGEEEKEDVFDEKSRPSTSKPAPRRTRLFTESRESFSVPRRLTYDYQENLKLLSTLPPTTRNYVTVLIYAIGGLVLLTVSLAAGLPLLGRVYDPYILTNIPTNGALPTRESFIGLILLLYMGPGGIMLLANLIPSVVVVGFRFNVARALVAFFAVASIVGMSLSMAYLVQPQGTFDESLGVGSEDPLLATIGVFYFLGFAFLFFIAVGILVHMTPQLSDLRKALHSKARKLNYRVVLFLIMMVVFAFTLSNFMCNPVGAGETWSGAYFRATSPYSLVNWEWETNFIYKLFPDVLAYYLYIAVVVVVAVVAHRYPKAYHWLHRRCWAPRVTSGSSPILFPYGVSNGECLLILSFLMFFVFWVCYWRIVFDYTENKAEAVSKEDVAWETTARNFGHIINLYVSLAMFPASRTGLWVDIFGVPYDRAIAYHRSLGAIAFFFITCHCMTWWTKWLYEGNLGHNLFGFNHFWISPVRATLMDFSLPIIETAWFLMGVSLISAFFLRRKLYSIFQYSHKYIGVIFYITAIIHAWSFWYFAAGSLFLFYVDKVSRGVRAAYLSAPKSIEWHPRNAVVKLTLSKESFSAYEPGQYFFINIPQLSINEWHPFTASAVLDDIIVFYIKAMPRNEKYLRIPWTQRLATLVQSTDALPLIRVSGPFGHTRFTDHESLIMYAGGIGITPMISIFTSLLKRAKAGESVGNLKSVALIWMSRSTAEFRMFEEIFEMVHTSSVLFEENAVVETAACRFHVRLFCTRRESFQSLTAKNSIDYTKLFIAQGRCDVQGILSQFISKENPNHTYTAVCGPTALTYAVSRAAWDAQADFHSEQFTY